ncbi:MAG: AI-2E family transporter [Candidatus Fermentithermobacillus carboniphilus]|uniref:AI-2E family transporter n=1 Tax=Candidatus Fermentithermobacillus carboniphilus TaxID=3085328 RepID=A0AAT9LAG4_9FIRM|nr:MAG: AI-2E family transporter [Candidatus Fermentithermobacillus carboniphilus]
MRGILAPFVIAAFLSYVLEPVVSTIHRWGIPRARAILFVYLLLFSAAFLLGVYFIPGFIRDVRELSAALPQYIESLERLSVRTREIANRYDLPPGLERGVLNALGRLDDSLDRAGEKLVSYVFSSLTILSYVVVAPIIAYYILRDINKWRQKSLVFFARHPLPYLDLFRDIDRVLGGFVRGQSIVALFVMLMVWVASVVLGLKYGAVLGVIGGLGEFIPYFGPIIAAVPMLTVAFLKSTVTGFWALGFILVIQWIDSNLIVPRVTGPRVGLHPLWIIFSLLAGGELLGFWGIFLAVPAAGIIKAVMKFAGAMFFSGNGKKGSS